MTRLASRALVIAPAIAALAPAAAGASWSLPQSFPAPRAGAADVAAGARGVAAVAWATRGSAAVSPTYRTSVHVLLRDARGRLARRTLWSSRNAAVDGISVAVDARGVTTVAWSAFARGRGRGAVRAVRGRFAGRWPRPQVVGTTTGTADGLPPDRRPRLAVAPGGDVLLVWEDRTAMASWRRGGTFGAPRVLSGLHDPVAAFDAAGSAYVWGPCDGVVLRAPPRGRRLRRLARLAPAGSVSFNLSLAGRGEGLASWVDGRCSTDVMAGNAPGPVRASRLRDGAFAAPVPVSAPMAQAPYARGVAVPGGGAVSWLEDGRVLTRFLEPGGGFGASVPAVAGLHPVAAGGAGDTLLALPPFAVPPGPPAAPAVHRADGRPDEPAPAPAGLVATAPAGRAAIAAWGDGPDRLALSVWRP